MEDMYVKIGGALVLLLTNLALFFKSKADINSVKNDRLQTKETRDRDSQALHDEVLELRFKYTVLRDAQQLQEEKLNDVSRQSGFIVEEVAILSTKIDNLLELVKEGRSNANKTS